MPSAASRRRVLQQRARSGASPGVGIGAQLAKDRPVAAAKAARRVATKTARRRRSLGQTTKVQRRTTVADARNAVTQARAAAGPNRSARRKARKTARKERRNA